MREHLSLLARYHHWAFEQLYDALVPVEDQYYHAACGLFFGSIHRTLNHLLLADRVWYGRVTGVPFVVEALDTELERERVALANALAEQSARWITWLESEDDHTLARTLTYTNLAGASFDNPLAHVLLHVFNHGTHHRGQISAALSSGGHVAPVMDLIFFLRGLGQPLPTV